MNINTSRIAFTPLMIYAFTKLDLSKKYLELYNNALKSTDPHLESLLESFITEQYNRGYINGDLLFLLSLDELKKYQKGLYSPFIASTTDIQEAIDITRSKINNKELCIYLFEPNSLPNYTIEKISVENDKTSKNGFPEFLNDSKYEILFNPLVLTDFANLIIDSKKRDQNLTNAIENCVFKNFSYCLSIPIDKLIPIINQTESEGEARDIINNAKNINFDIDNNLSNIENLLMLYLHILTLTIKENSSYINFDRLFLCCSYRYGDFLQKNSQNLSKDHIAQIHDYLNKVAEYFKTKELNKEKISSINGNGDSADGSSSYKIIFNYKDFKNLMKRFVREDTFISDQQIDSLSEIINNGEVELKKIGFQIIQFLDLSNIASLLGQNNSNLKYFLNNIEDFERNAPNTNLPHFKDKKSNKISIDIPKILSEIPFFSSDNITLLLEKEYINKDDIFNYHSAGKITNETFDYIINALYTNNNISLDDILNYYTAGKINNEIFSKYYHGDDLMLLILDNKLSDDNKTFSLFKENYITDIASFDLFLENPDGNHSKLKELVIEEIKNYLSNQNISEENMPSIMSKLKQLDYNNLSITSKDSNENTIWSKSFTEADDNQKASLAMFAYAQSGISLEELGKMYSSDKYPEINENNLFNAAIKGYFNTSQIIELYKNSYISDDTLENLSNKNIISEIELKNAKESLTIQQLLQNLDNSRLGFSICYKEDDFNYENNPYMNTTFELDYNKNNTDKTTVIPPVLRECLFSSLLFYKIARTNVLEEEKSPFYNYEFYINPTAFGIITPDSPIIAERFVDDRTDANSELVSGNATYILTLKDLCVLDKKSKSEVINEMKSNTSGSLKRLYHTHNWPQKTASFFNASDSNKSIYMPDELNLINRMINYCSDPRIWNSC